VVGAATGVAPALKHSAVLLLPITPVLLVFELVRPRAEEKRAQVLRLYAAAFAAASSSDCRSFGLPTFSAFSRTRMEACTPASART
jgi:hypothetical protein